MCIQNMIRYNLQDKDGIPTINPINTIGALLLTIILMCAVPWITEAGSGWSALDIVLGFVVSLIFNLITSTAITFAVMSKQITLWMKERVLYRVRQVTVEDDLGRSATQFNVERAQLFPIGWGFWRVQSDHYGDQDVAVKAMIELVEKDQKQLMELRLKYNKGQSLVVTDNISPVPPYRRYHYKQSSDMVGALDQIRDSNNNVKAGNSKRGNNKTVRVGRSRGKKRSKKPAS